MQFKHPELLYALFLLLIPILIHLFQLRRFQKIEFTNVAFLKKVTIQTRKSSQLKKWIILLTRLLALACVILAFAQPFTASKSALNKQKETVIYIDNSFSMQAKGSEGPLLNRALQQLYELNNSDDKISWFTNDISRRNASVQDFKNEILAVNYTQNQLSPEEIILTAERLFSKDETSEKRLIIISDFQQKGNFPIISEDIKVNAVQLKPNTINNITVDSAFIISKNTSNTELGVILSRQGNSPVNVPVSLFKENSLMAKTAVDFSNKTQQTITFDLENTDGFKGELSLNDPNLVFDNSLFFSINTTTKIKVLSINEANSNFLDRLFSQEAYDYTQQSIESLNYNDIPSQNFIILNELKTIPSSLATSLISFSSQGGSILIIPSAEIDLNNYNSLLLSLGIGSLENEVIQKKNISKIRFSHPLYQDVFEKQVVNFQYPIVRSFFNVSTQAVSPLSYADDKAFIIQNQKNYFITAAINNKNSNFINSPLIVPTILNMAQQSLPLPKLYYNIGQQNTFSVPITLSQDEIVKLIDSVQSFIPLQQTKANQVIITTSDEPAISGVYDVQKNEETIEHLSYNYNREESNLIYNNVDDWNGVKSFDNVGSLFETIAEENAINSFWKWFVIFAILFLILEMMILKFSK